MAVPLDREDFVTVVSGPPRSGTSMMMRMLEAGGIPPLTDDVRRADVDNPRGYYELEAVKRTLQDSSWLCAAEGKAVKMVYTLLYDLPFDFDYRVVFLRRRMEEVIASQELMLRRRGGKESDVLALEDLSDRFEKELAKVGQWLRAQDNFEVLEVDYNAMIADPLPQILALDRFLGGGLDTRAMAAAVEPELYRQRR
jgi:hypothetical protein